MKNNLRSSVVALAASLAIAMPFTSAGAIIFDDFNVNEGHFNRHPTYSGSTVGLNASSTADRVTTDDPFEGAGHQRLVLTATTGAIRVRHVSGDGIPANNTAFTTSAGTDGWIGFYIKTTVSGWTAQIWIEGPENNGSVPKTIIADGQWHLYEWNLDDETGGANGWGAVAGIVAGDADVQAGSYTIDSILLRHATGGASANGTFYLDFVAKSDSGSIAAFADSTWDGGGGDNNWSTAANWTDGIAPASSGDGIVFAGTTRLTPNMQANYNATKVQFNNGAGAFTVGGSSTLTLSGDVTQNDDSIQTINVPISIAATRTLNAASGDLVLGGIISGAGGITKSGANILTLNAANSYNGNTTVSAGTLKLGNANAIPNGSGKGNVSVTGTLDLNTFNQTINGLSGAGTVDKLAAGSATLTVGDNNQTSAFSGVIKNTSGTVALTKIGTGTLSLTAVNTYSGDTTINAGQVSIDGDGTLGDGTGTLHLSGGRLNTTANRSVTAAPVGNPINLTADSEVTTSSAAGTLDLNFNNNSIGGSGGTLTFRNDGADGAADRFDPRFSGGGFNFPRPIVIDNGGVGLTRLNLYNSSTDAAQTFSGVISGNGSVNRSHASAGGVTIFTGANTYSGGTVVHNGTLLVNNTTGSGTGSGDVTVNASGTIGGTGTVGGAIALSGAISPGASVGELNTGAETWNSGGDYAFEIESATGTAGTDWDLLDITGNLDVQATSGNKFTVAVTTLSGGSPGNMANFSAANTDYSWPIATVSTTIDNFATDKFTVDTAGVVNGLSGGHFEVGVNGTDLELQFKYNRPPVAGTDNVTRNRGASLKIPKSTLLGNDTDVDTAFVGDAVSFVSVSGSSVNGATITSDAMQILFAPADVNDTAADSFTYTITDAHGHSVNGTVNVTVNSGASGGVVQTIDTSGGTVTVRFAGIPNYQYDVERADDAGFTVNLTTLVTTNAPANGVFSITDGPSPAPPFPSAYYRLKYNP